MSEKKLDVKFIRDKNDGSVSLVISGLSPQEVEPFYQKAKELIDSGLMDADITVVFRFKKVLAEDTPPE